MGYIGSIVAVATIGGFLFGYDSGAVNGTQEGLRNAFSLGEGGLGFTVGSLLIGCFIGAFFAGRLADLMGRRNTMMLAAVLFLVGAILQGVAESHLLFLAARIMGGMAVGAASVLSPAYISEVAPAAIRGRLTTLQQIMIITGLTAAFLVNYFLAAGAGASTEQFWLVIEAWRWMYLMQALPAAIFLAALLFIPESPRYLVSKGRDEKALAVLTSLFGSDVAGAKLQEIRATFSEDHRPRLSDLKAPGGGIRPIVWAGILLAVFQQLVGINVIFYYGATLWQLAGFTEDQSLQINIVSGAVSIAACFLTIALIAANLYVIFFNVSWGPVMWVMLGEMFPNQIRGSALAVAGFAQWFSNYLIAQSFPIMAASLGLALSYSFYAVSAVISFFLVLKFINETKGKELEDMPG